MDIFKASDNLSRLNLKLDMDNYVVDILWFRAMVNKGRWCINRHTHSSYEFHFVAAGACEVILDDARFVARKGELYLTPPGVYHEQKDCGENYTEYSINCDFIKKQEEITETEALFDILSSAACKIFNDNYNILNLFYTALEEAYYGEIGFYNNIKNLASMIITLTVRGMNENKLKNEYLVPEKMEKDAYRFKLIEKFIEDNLGNNITTKALADFMFLSDKQVYRIIKEKTGKSSKEFINGKKLRRAKELLKYSDLKIKEISEILGFTSEYYFNQFFKREEGYPPGLYRVNVQNVQKY